MFEAREIVCFTVTLSIFRAYQIFPKKGEELNPGVGFYIKFVIGCFMGSIILLGSFLHLIHTIIAEQYNRIDLDLSYVLSMTSGYLLYILFSFNITAASKMYMFLSDFKQFGKPPKFDRYNTFLNRVSKYHFVYLGIISTLFVMSSNIFKGHQCREDNIQYGYNESCGLITNTWLPFDIDYFPMKQIYLCLQFFSIYYVYMLAGSIPFLVAESVLHVGVRLDHVKQLFIDVLNGNGEKERRKRFNFAVRYHGRVLELERELNTCLANSIFTHMILTASIIGCAAYGFIQSGSANPFAVCIGWLNGVSVICVSGQYLTNKSLEIGTAIYETTWYNMEHGLQKDLVMVLMRCQTPMVLRAAGFGVMSNTVIIAVLQASYSYITLLSRGG